MGSPRLEVFATAEELEGRAAGAIADGINDAIHDRARCTLALSRASSLLRRLARSSVDWSAVDVFQVDERVAPDGHADRNLTLIQSELCAGVDGKGPNVHAMPVTEPNLDDAAARYARELEEVCGRPPVLDVVALGVGPDGHTASLVPGDPVLDIRDRWVAVTRTYEGFRRMTLTYPVLDAARRVVVVVAGQHKAEALARIFSGDESLPAARVRAENVLYLCDGAAAAQLSGA